jgi:Mrp family chromosome partitioning ATPase
MKSTTLKLAGAADFFTQEAYKTLRTNLQFSGKDIHVIAITSCHENEGKTTVTLNLARSLAELGKRVLVIDADMRKSVVASRHTSTRKLQIDIANRDSAWSEPRDTSNGTSDATPCWTCRRHVLDENILHA